MGTKNNPSEFDCYASAEPDEPMFVLLARDPMAPILVRIWADLRHHNAGNPSKVSEALGCAVAMERWRSRHVEGAEEHPLRHNVLMGELNRVLNALALELPSSVHADVSTRIRALFTSSRT